MMFQIIGILGLNQRAREVPPFKSSLTTTGLYLVLTRHRILWWAGSEYFANYLSDDNYADHSVLVSEELLTRVVLLYDSSCFGYQDDLEDEESKGATKVSLEERKQSFLVEGTEDDVW